MATYKRLDSDQLIFLVQYLLTKLKNSSLATDTNTTYTMSRSGDNILLKDDKGETISTVSAKTLSDGKLTMNTQTNTITGTTGGYADAGDVANAFTYMVTVMSNFVTNTTLTEYSTTEQMNIKLGNYVTNTKLNDYSTTAQMESAISTAVGNVSTISFSVVQSLPTKGNATTIYLVSNSGTGTNIYDEYIYVNSKWEKIGTTEVDLSGYVKSTDMSTLTNDEITKIVDDAYTEVFK